MARTSSTGTQEPSMKTVTCTVPRTTHALIVIGIIALLLSVHSTALAQSQSAGIIGVVSDSGGAVIPNATVTITSPALQVSQLTTASDVQGNYKFVDLPAPGVYRVTFEAKGFKREARNGVTLTV